MTSLGLTRSFSCKVCWWKIVFLAFVMFLKNCTDTRAAFCNPIRFTWLKLFLLVCSYIFLLILNRLITYAFLHCNNSKFIHRYPINLIILMTQLILWYHLFIFFIDICITTLLIGVLAKFRALSSPPDFYDPSYLP